MSFGEENGVPRLRLILKEINPEPIIRHQKFPGFAHRSESRRLARTENSENLHEDIDWNPIELPGRRIMDVHHLEEAVVLRCPVRVGNVVRTGRRRRSVEDGSPNLPNQRVHGWCIRTGIGMSQKVWGYGGRTIDDGGE